MDEEIEEIVNRHGWFAANVNDGAPPFLYSVGLAKTWQHPELIVFGLESDQSYCLIGTLVDEIRDGRNFSTPGIFTITIGNDEHRVGIRHVHATQHQLYLGFAMGFARRACLKNGLRAMQVFWPDRNGKFPFDVGCELSVFTLQPRIDIALSSQEVREFERQFE